MKGEKNSVLEFSIIFDLICICIIATSIRFRYRRVNNIDIFIMFSLTYSLYYNFIPIILKLTEWTEYDSVTGRTLYYISEERFAEKTIIVILGYIIFIIFNRFIFERNLIFNKKSNYNLRVKKSYKYIKCIGHITFLLGGISFFAIAISVGGISKLITLGENMRIYGQDLGTYIPRSLLPFRTLMTIICTSTFIYYLVYSIKKSMINKILVVLSMTISILYLIFNSGRAPIFFFILPFILFYIYKKFKRPVLILCGLVIFLIPALLFMDRLFLYIGYGEWRGESVNYLNYFVEQFGFPYINILNSNEIVDIYNLRYGVDLFTWIINVVPVSILSVVGLWKVPVSSDLITGYYSSFSEGPMLGGIPADILTTGYMQYKFIGVLFIMALIGVVIGIIDSRVHRAYTCNLFNNIFIYRIVISFFNIVSNANLDAFIRGKLDLIIMIGIILIIFKKNKGEQI
ncbi:MAG: O-antigen polymerase [Sarcina sp.]